MSGQYVAYSLYKVDPAWRRLPVEERRAGKDAFAEVVEDWAGRMGALRAYSTAGVRPDCDFFLWKITDRYADLGVNWYGGAHGLQVLAFVGVLVLSGVAMWRTWRDQHTYS